MGLFARLVDAGFTASLLVRGRVPGGTAAAAAQRYEAIRMRERGLRTVPTSIGIERATNPFLRSGEPSLRRAAAARLGREPASRLEAFAALREWKNVYR